MKKLILIALAAISTVAVNAQVNSSSPAKGDMDLISMNEGESKYYSNTGDYSVDESGRVSGQVLTFHDNGNLEEQGALLMGKKQGSWTKYSPEGVKMNQAKYVNGEKDGEWKVWDATGILRMELNYDQGKRVGTWNFYDEEGKLQSSKDYN